MRRYGPPFRRKRAELFVNPRSSGEAHSFFLAMPTELRFKEPRNLVLVLINQEFNYNQSLTSLWG